MHRSLNTLLVAAVVLGGCDTLVSPHDRDEEFTASGEWELSIGGVPLRLNPSDPPDRYSCTGQPGSILRLTQTGSTISGTLSGLSFYCADNFRPGLGESTATGTIEGDRLSLVITSDEVPGSTFMTIEKIDLSGGLVIPPSDTPGGAVTFTHGTVIHGAQPQAEVVHWAGAGANRTRLTVAATQVWLGRPGAN